jgi:flagellar biosynthesis protein FlhF
MTINIKTFRAHSLQEGLRLVYEELGEDAKVMHTRETDESRFFGLWRRRFVEITAAKNQDISVSKNDDSIVLQLQESSPYELLLSPPIPQRLRSESQTVHSESVQNSRHQPVPLGVWRQLTAEQLNPTVLQRSLIAIFSEWVRFGGPLDLRDGQRKTVALLGPTGVGKTSTIAKIAAHYRLKEFKRVGLITVDTFRIAATEQLGKYAEMLAVPMETVSEPFRMKTALARLENCDLILMDTPGTNPKNIAKLQTLGAMLDAAMVDEVHLLFSATSSLAVLTELLKRFEPLVPTDLTITKLDEAAGLTDIYRFLKKNALPLRFFCFGQNISEDIEVAAPPRLASLV